MTERIAQATAPVTVSTNATHTTFAVNAATDTAVGVVELATTAEATTGTDTTRAVTAAGVKAVVDAHVAAGDPHPGYLTAAEGNAAYLALVAGGSSVENVGAIESNVQTVGATGATETLDTATYGVFDMTMDQACTFTFSNPAPSGKATIFTLILRGAFTPTLPASVDWADAAAPTYATPSVYVFTTVDAGTTWLGSRVGKAFG